MTELDLTQRLPPITIKRPGAASISGRETRTFALIDPRGFTDPATIADLLSCLAALPVETRCGVVAKQIESMPVLQRMSAVFEALPHLRELAGVHEHAEQAESALSTATSRIAELEREVERLKQANASASEAVDRALRCDNWSDRLTAIRDARDRLERVMPKGSGT